MAEDLLVDNITLCILRQYFQSFENYTLSWAVITLFSICNILISLAAQLVGSFIHWANVQSKCNTTCRCVPANLFFPPIIISEPRPPHSLIHYGHMRMSTHIQSSTASHKGSAHTKLTSILRVIHGLPPTHFPSSSLWKPVSGVWQIRTLS